jgi:hypothetical protein
MVGYRAIYTTRDLLRSALFTVPRSLSTHAAASAVSATLPSLNHTHLEAPAAIIPDAPSSLATTRTEVLDRFDWRLRALSRRNPPTEEATVRGRRRKYIKRVPSQEHDLHLGEPFYEETRAYRDR